MAKSTFSSRATDTLVKNGKKAIDDLLHVLDSEIVYPLDRKGNVKEERLLAVVKSREQISVTVFNLMDMLQVDKSRDTHLKSKLIKGFKRTFEELNGIIIRDVRIAYVPEGDEDEAEQELAKLRHKLNAEHEDDDENKEHPVEISDDYLSSVAKSKETAYRICQMLIDKIALLENPDAINQEKLDSIQTPSIVERYAR